MKTNHTPSSISVQARNSVKNALAIAAAEGRSPRILFVCLGNICRSPAAHGIMEAISSDLPPHLRPEIDSCGFYGGHAGELPDHRMRTAAMARGLRLTHRSRPIRPSDFEEFDLILGMDDSNMRNLRASSPTPETDRKLARMADFAVNYPEFDHVPDPYYEGAEGFRLVLDLLQDGCSTLKQLLLQAEN